MLYVKLEVKVLYIVGTNSCLKELKLLYSTAGQRPLHRTITFSRSTLLRVLSI